MTAKPWPKPSDDQPAQTPPAQTWSQRGTSVVDVMPTPGVLPGQNLRSWANWRAFVHQVTPVIVTALVGIGIVTDNQAALWVPLFFAIADPLLSLGNTQDKVRQIIYGLAGLLQVGGIGAGLVTGLGLGGNGVIAAGIGAGVTVLSTFLARFYTPTTTMTPAT